MNIGRLAIAMAMCWTCVGCAADVGGVVAELPRGDCRIDETCDHWGPADRAETPPRPPPPDAVPTCGGATRPSFPSPSPYPTDHADWMRAAHRFATGLSLPTGYANFHEANYGQGTVNGTIVLGTTAIAYWVDVRQRLLIEGGGYARLENVPVMMRTSQAFARSRGYSAALPTFEQGLDANGEVVFGISILSPAAVEVREVDGCELAIGDPNDVGGMFRGAHAYAEREGFAGAIPTFETRVTADGRRRIHTLILLRHGDAAWSDVPETEISPHCGRDGLALCDHLFSRFACMAGHHAEAIYNDGICVRDTPPPPCGGRGERCCTGGGCDEPALRCQSMGLFRPSVCDFERPPVERCGDGTCMASEACWCQEDCAETEICRALLPCDGEEPSMYPFCVNCPGEYRTELTVSACAEEQGLDIARRNYDGCEVWAGHEDCL